MTMHSNFTRRWSIKAKIKKTPSLKATSYISHEALDIFTLKFCYYTYVPEANESWSEKTLFCFAFSFSATCTCRFLLIIARALVWMRGTELLRATDHPETLQQKHIHKYKLGLCQERTQGGGVVGTSCSQLEYTQNKALVYAS